MAGALVAAVSASCACQSASRRPAPSGARCSAALRLQVSARSAGGSTGGNVLDKPSLGSDLEKRKDRRSAKPPIYRVLLHNDEFNRREYVVSVILKVVEGYTVDQAVGVMQEAHINGLGLVTQCAQEEAERYCEGLRGGGLTASIEPAGNGGK